MRRARRPGLPRILAQASRHPITLEPTGPGMKVAYRQFGRVPSADPDGGLPERLGVVLVPPSAELTRAPPRDREDRIDVPRPCACGIVVARHGRIVRMGMV